MKLKTHDPHYYFTVGSRTCVAFKHSVHLASGCNLQRRLCKGTHLPTIPCTILAAVSLHGRGAWAGQRRGQKRDSQWPSGMLYNTPIVRTHAYKMFLGTQSPLPTVQRTMELVVYVRCQVVTSDRQDSRERACSVRPVVYCSTKTLQLPKSKDRLSAFDRKLPIHHVKGF